ncbi:helix-turn-helix domain-containing protein, partial [Xanthomonas citri]|uniref:helix-turn-helix domain-containing protein n=7 Tax=Xanthomonas citri TaxID=346 RepID=UPI0032E905BA
TPAWKVQTGTGEGLTDFPVPLLPEPRIELAKARDKYRGRPADQAIHARIVALRGRGETIANTARLAGTSVTTVKRVWAAHQAQQES